MLAVEEEEVVVAPEERVWLESRSECWCCSRDSRSWESLLCSMSVEEATVGTAGLESKEVNGGRSSCCRERETCCQAGREAALEQYTPRLGRSLSGQPGLICWSPPSPPHRRWAVPLYCPDRIAAGGFSASPGRRMAPPLLHLCYLRRTLRLWRWARTWPPSEGRCLRGKRRSVQIYAPAPTAPVKSPTEGNTLDLEYHHSTWWLPGVGDKRYSEIRKIYLMRTSKTVKRKALNFFFFGLILWYVGSSSLNRGWTHTPCNGSKES